MHGYERLCKAHEWEEEKQMSTKPVQYRQVMERNQWKRLNNPPFDRLRLDLFPEAPCQAKENHMTWQKPSSQGWID